MPTQAHVSVRNRTTVRFDLLQLGAVRLGMQLASRVAPTWAEEEAARLFLTPRRPASSPEPVLAGGVRPERRELSTGSHRLATYTWGRGERVLLVHGWEGRAGQFIPFAERLVGRGYQAVAIDLPGHGHSSGRETSMLDVARALQAVARELGGFKAVIAHSLGGAATAFAATEAPMAERLVLLAPAAEPRHFADRAAKFLALPQARLPGMYRCIEERVGRPLEDANLARYEGSIEQPLLVLHDEADREVPLAHGRIAAAVSRNGKLEVVTGLGHRRILKSAEVVGRAVEFALATGK